MPLDAFALVQGFLRFTKDPSLTKTFRDPLASGFQTSHAAEPFHRRISSTLCSQESNNGATKPDGMPVYYGRGGKYSGKPRVVVLGSGWGAMSFIKSLSRRDRCVLCTVSQHVPIYRPPLHPWPACLENILQHSLHYPSCFAWLHGIGKQDGQYIRIVPALHEAEVRAAGFTGHMCSARGNEF